MAIEPYTGIDLPDELDADDVPAWFASIFSSLSSLLVLSAQNIAERDAKYADAPKGFLVRTIDEFAVWMKTATGTNTWVNTLYDKRVTTGYTGLSSDYTMNSFILERSGRAVQLRAQLTRKNTDLAFNAYNSAQPGNITDTALFILPAGFEMYADTTEREWYGRSSYYTVQGYISSAEQVTLTNGTPSGKNVVGTGLYVYCNWIGV